MNQDALDFASLSCWSRLLSFEAAPFYQSGRILSGYMYGVCSSLLPSA